MFTEHRISSLPIRAKYKHFKTIWEQTLLYSPTDFNSSSLKWWSSTHGVDTLCSCWVVLFANSQYRSTHFLAWNFQIIRPWRNTNIIRVCLFLPRKFAIQTWLCNCQQYLCLFHIVFEYTWSRKMLVLPNQLLCLVLSTSDYYFVSFQPILRHAHTQIRKIPFWRCTDKHSQFGTFSQPCFSRIFSNCLSHNSPAKGWPYRFRSRGTAGSLEFLVTLMHLPFFTWV